jgi:SAM-dependent methyltransferase
VTTEPFSEKDYLPAFQEFRRLSEALLLRYLDWARIDQNRTGRFLDVGAGPGIQAVRILDALPTTWSIVALEPTANLSAAAREALAPFGARAVVVEAQLSAFKELNGFHAAWLSEVVHVLGDPIAWAEDLSRLLAPGATAVIRTSTHEQLHTRKWYNEFPAARAVDLARHPSSKSVHAALLRSGFSSVEEIVIDESRMVSSMLYLSMLKARCFSTLRLISDREFIDGYELARKKFSLDGEVRFDYEMTAYVATR